MKNWLWAAALLWAGMLATTASAQEVARPWEEYGKLIKASETVTALGPTLFGDAVNLQNGALSFSTTDVAVRGNSGLPVAVSRSYSVISRKGMASDGHFADWDLELPNISGVFANNWPANRCTGTGRPGTVSSGGSVYVAEDYWQGTQANMPGGGELLQINAAAPRPTSGGPYLWTTSGNVVFACLGSIRNGSGEGFLAITPDGTRYWFDWMAGFVQPGLKGGGRDSTAIARSRQVLYATRVEDRFGNWVTYTFGNASNQPGRLARIDSNDGRAIVLGYNAQGHIDSVATDTRSWTYQYSYPSGGLATLIAVVQPDATRWTINFSAFTNLKMRYEEGQCYGVGLTRSCDPVRSCGDPGQIITPGAIGTMTHPSGAAGEFVVEPHRHGRSNVPMVCGGYSTPNNDPNDDVAYYPLSYDAYTLFRKTVTGPGLLPAQWLYNYRADIYFAPGTGPVCSGGTCGAPLCTSDGCAGTSVTVVQGPNNQWTRHTFGNSFKYNEGKLLKTERGTGPNAIQKVERYTYNWATSGQPYPTPIGTSQQARGDNFTAEYLRPQSGSVIEQDGATFHSQVNSFDAFARAVSIGKWSSLGYGKTEITEYYDHMEKWVLGQVRRQVNADTGLVISRTEYNANAQPWQVFAFEKLQQSFGYWPDGALANVTDGRNYTTSLHSWHRGVPRRIDHPDGAVRSASVNDAGWVTSIVDENGASTGYGYDAMGRLAAVVYPTGDSTVWHNTQTEFRPLNSGDWLPPGVSAGQWRQLTVQGHYIKAVYFDGLWRPVLSLEYDNTNISGTMRSTRTGYDSAGGVSFQSYPVTEATPTFAGTHTTYDALGRPTRVEQDSELGRLVTTTEYLPGLQTRVTNPRSQATTTGYVAWDQPSYDLPAWSVMPEGAVTEIRRDLFGKPTSLRRRNSDASKDVWRHYVYDGHQQLCKTIEPETGATVMDYDGAGNLHWSASGLHNLMNAGSCDTVAGRDSGRKVTRYYDVRNRLTTLDFPDGNGDQTFEYYADGKPRLITIYNDNGTSAVVNRYDYNRRGLLTAESSTQPGWYSWGIGYGYDPHGNLSTQTNTATGALTHYAPNALGQATQVAGNTGTYAHGISYYPNGAIRQFTYGNGVVHTMQQNARQLPARVASGAGVYDFQYHYDGNGNVHHVNDVLGGEGWSPLDKWMSYDGLDRLTAAGSGSFGGDHWHRFGYDALDNLTSWIHGGVKDYAQYLYDGNNRLASIRDSANNTVVGVSYDLQGNLYNKNGRIHQFDFGNRLRSVDGRETYRYDGLGRRVLSSRAASVVNSQVPDLTLSVYSQAGQLTFEHTNRDWTEYYYLAGSLIGSRTANLATGAFTRKFHHTDALGSPVAVTNEAAQVIERTNWEPYGAAIGKQVQGVGYTGHVMDAATGLTYMQQRYYDPQVGRFLSVDPVAARQGGDNFNRYTYANNNPYRFKDPDGREVAGIYSPSNNLLFMVDKDTRAWALVQGASGGKPYGDPIPAGNYDILERAGRDGFYRLERRDGSYGDDDSGGRTNLRLHGPGRTIGCIEVCTTDGFRQVRGLLDNTSTSTSQVQSKSLGDRIRGRSENLTNYGSLGVLPAGHSLGFNHKTNSVVMRYTETGSRIVKERTICSVAKDGSCK